MDWIKPLQDITLADIDTVGAKAAHLGAMLRAGFPVPPGFVITTDAFVEHFGNITDPLVRPSTPRLNQELMAAVVAGMVTHLGEEIEVAVRSSSTEEDTSFASFAGQHSTYYFVPPSHLDQAVIDCWLSLWSTAATAYRRGGWGQVVSGAPLRMAVIVQKMLPATRSGVAFSRDPVSSSTDTVIESSWGLGAALVDGRVAGDQARVSDEGKLLNYTVRDKRVQVLHHASNHNASRLQPVTQANRNAEVLSSAEAERIASIAGQLETLFDAPQDVEFAFVDNDLFLLQSRPITTRPPTYNFDDPLVLFKPLAENFTEPLTPLSADLFAQALPRLGAFVDGRLYLSLRPLQRLIPFEMTDRETCEMMLLRGNPRDVKVSWPRLLKSIGIGAAFYLADGANWHRAARLSLDDLEKFRRVAERVKHREALSLTRAMRRLVWGRHSFMPTYHQMFTLNISAGRYFLFIGALENLVQRFAPDFPVADLPRTYHGRQDMRSLEMLDELSNLAMLLNRSPELTPILETETALPIGHEFTVAYDDFIQKYGHRGPRELDIAAPRWRESPRDLLGLLVHETDTAANVDRSHGQYLAARDQLHSHLKPWQRGLVDWLTKRITHFIALRENTRYFHIMAFDSMRTRVLNIEKSLFNQNRLEHEGDIFFLLVDEVEALQAGRLAPSDAQAKIRARRRKWQIGAARRPPETINVDWSGETEPSELWQCASPGSAQGLARVIMDPSQGAELQAGEILIAPYTDPAWTPLFQKAAAIIVGTGSFLSHAGTVARELHVPCLVDVADCTTLYKTGEQLIVDASSCTIEVVHDADAAREGRAND
ncbi:MAG: hypothetical protein GKR90_07770 [Pseudomonadales bacterium]|nr:hypothetical protein [Pseudomonadales bacterium]